MRKVKTIDCVASVQSYINKGGDGTVLESRTEANFVVFYATLEVRKRRPAAKVFEQIIILFSRSTLHKNNHFVLFHHSQLSAHIKVKMRNE